jgi:3-isopropylmalate dehydrogenase
MKHLTIENKKNSYRLSKLVSKHPPRSGEILPLAILPGEGIGPELMAACEPILQAIESHTMHRFSREYGGKIGKQAIVDSGTSLTADVIDFCRQNFQRGAPLFCGPGGDRFVYKLRSVFDIYCKFVPIKPLPALRDTGVMREEAVNNVDILLIRENVGGVYQGAWHFEHTDRGRRAHHSFHYDEFHVQRIMELAVAAAQQRESKLCVVHKPGGTPSISELWTEIARTCTADCNMELRFLEVDTAAYLLLAEASTFDVIVTPNMFGDVLADAAALLLGSRGMSYSYNVSEQGHAVYQTGHGAAYELAGTGVANPLGQIQTLASLLRESYGLFGLSEALYAACNRVLADGVRTRDIMTKDARLVSTAEMGAAIADQLAGELIVGNSMSAIN